MMRYQWNDVGDDIHDSANRAGSIENCRGATNHVDLRNADCLDWGGVRGVERRQITHAKPIFENQHLIVTKASLEQTRGCEPQHLEDPRSSPQKLPRNCSGIRPGIWTRLTDTVRPKSVRL